MKNIWKKSEDKEIISLSKLQTKKKANITTQGHYSKLLNEYNSNFSVISGGEGFVGVHSYSKNKYIIVCYLWKEEKFIKIGNVRSSPIRNLCYNTQANVICENTKKNLILHRVHAKNKNGQLAKELKKNVSFK